MSAQSDADADSSSRAAPGPSHAAAAGAGPARAEPFAPTQPDGQCARLSHTSPQLVEMEFVCALCYISMLFLTELPFPGCHFVCSIFCVFPSAATAALVTSPSVGLLSDLGRSRSIEPAAGASLRSERPSCHSLQCPHRRKLGAVPDRQQRAHADRRPPGLLRVRGDEEADQAEVPPSRLRTEASHSVSSTASELPRARR